MVVEVHLRSDQECCFSSGLCSAGGGCSTGRAGNESHGNAGHECGWSIAHGATDQLSSSFDVSTGRFTVVGDSGGAWCVGIGVAYGHVVVAGSRVLPPHANGPAAATLERRCTEVDARESLG